VLMELSRVEQRYDAVVAVIRDGLTVTEVAARTQIAKAALRPLGPRTLRSRTPLQSLCVGRNTPGG